MQSYQKYTIYKILLISYIFAYCILTSITFATSNKYSSFYLLSKKKKANKKTVVLKRPPGISPIFLDLNIKQIELKLKIIDPNFIGLKTTQKDLFFQVIPKLKDKKIKIKDTIIIDNMVYYTRIKEFLLTPSVNDKKNSLVYHPKKTSFDTNKIHPKIKQVNLKFFDNKLYDIMFTVETSINEMNKLTDNYHKKYGEKSQYNKVDETYIWNLNKIKKNTYRYKVILKLSGEEFPRRLKVNFSNTNTSDKVWDYLEYINSAIDKILNRAADVNKL